MNEKKIFITGGAGWIGSKIIERYYNNNEIVVYSRDEAKHYFLKKKFPNVKFILGDVANLDSMRLASKNCNLGIFLAAIKQIEIFEENVEYGIDTVVTGALNSKKISTENNFESSCIISSDKSCSPSLAYGASKLLSESIFVNNNQQFSCKFSACRYGNVLSSKGSILPLIWFAIKNNIILELYHEEMTRFNILPEDAINLIEKSLSYKDVVVIPNLKSFKIKDLFDIFCDKFNLKYKITKPRANEKIHESLFSLEESRRIIYDKTEDFYLLGNNGTNLNNSYDFTSEKNLLSKEELQELLLKNRYFNE